MFVDGSLIFLGICTNCFASYFVSFSLPLSVDFLLFCIVLLFGLEFGSIEGGGFNQGIKNGVEMGGWEEWVLSDIIDSICLAHIILMKSFKQEM